MQLNKLIESEDSQAVKAVRPRVFLGIFLYQIGQYEQAIKYFKTAHMANPKKLRVVILLAKSELKAGHKKQAHNLLNQTREFYPNFELEILDSSSSNNSTS